MAGKRFLYIAIGCVATIVAIVGVWLPGIPTVPPLLLALWAFGRSSKRLHEALLNVPVLGSAINEARAYEKHRSISLKTKLVAQVSAWTSVVIAWLVTRNIWLVVGVAAAALLCSIVMILTPTRLSEKKTQTNEPA